MSRHILTVDEAIGVLADGDEIHTYTALKVPGDDDWTLAGFGWTREAVIAHIREVGGAQLAGPMMAGMGHGLCLHAGRRLFAATDAGRLAELEAKIAAEPQQEVSDG